MIATPAVVMASATSEADAEGLNRGISFMGGTVVVGWAVTFGHQILGLIYRLWK
jgi:hypothetical protein